MSQLEPLARYFEIAALRRDKRDVNSFTVITAPSIAQLRCSSRTGSLAGRTSERHIASAVTNGADLRPTPGMAADRVCPRISPALPARHKTRHCRRRFARVSIDRANSGRRCQSVRYDRAGPDEARSAFGRGGPRPSPNLSWIACRVSRLRPGQRADPRSGRGLCRLGASNPPFAASEAAAGGRIRAGLPRPAVPRRPLRCRRDKRYLSGVMEAFARCAGRSHSLLRTSADIPGH